MKKHILKSLVVSGLLFSANSLLAGDFCNDGDKLVPTLQNGSLVATGQEYICSDDIYRYETFTIAIEYQESTASPGQINMYCKQTQNTSSARYLIENIDECITILTPNAATSFSDLTPLTTNEKKNPVTPFAGITLTDADSTEFTATISLDKDEKGTLSTTTVSGDLATVQEAIQAITFTPALNRLSATASENVVITLKVNADGVDGTTKNTVTVKGLEGAVLNYQGFLAKDGVGVNETLSIKFNLYNNDVNETALWSSTKDVVISNGVYNVTLGETHILDDLDITNNSYYLGISIESNNEMTPRQIIQPSGYTKILIDRVNALQSN